MGYQALYRRYRPARFEDFVGQEAVIRTLRSQVMSGRVAHAYLFCGTRGTGKTSTAKVFARAVNCEHPEQGDPCGQCPTCLSLAAETSLDILEIDAASNNGVDEIRDLREKVKYPPQTGRYRVYIIDEVHMLSAGAFNALLKTLEEPPSYVVFILATTEPQKLPATILSRCQRFDFGRIPSAKIIERLRVALDDGGIAAEDAALARIARAAEGGMRDAWSIMDMCLSYAQEEGGLTEALVQRVLGASDRSFLFRFADQLIGSDAPGALASIDEMMRAGREVQVFVRDVSAHLRALMIAEVCGEEEAAELLETTREDAAAYAEQARRTTHERLMRMLDLFLQSETDMKWSAQPRFALETATLRACAPEESVQVEALVARVGELERRLREGVVVAEKKERKERRAAQDEGAQEAAPVPAAPAQEAAPTGPAPQAEAVWQEALRKIRAKPMIYGLARQGRLATAENGVFTVVFPKGSGAMSVRMLSMEDKQSELSAALSEAAGTPCTFRAAVEGTVPESDKAVLAAQEAAKKQAQDNLSRVTDFFGRENVTIRDQQ